MEPMDRPFRKQKRIGELCIEKGLISQRDLLQALKLQKIQSIPLGRVLLNLNKIRKKDLAAVLAEHFGVPQISLKNHAIDYKLQSRLNEHYAKEKNLIVLRDAEGNVKVASQEPTQHLFYDIRKQLDPNLQYQLCMAPAEEIGYAHRTIYAEKGKRKITYFPGGCVCTRMVQRSRAEDGQLTMTLVDKILQIGQRVEASDIHLEPLKERFRIRYRIEGDLNEIDVNNYELQILYQCVIARFKILGKLALDLKDHPQGGSFSIQYDNGRELQNIDYRISVLPTRYGEAMVLRVLNQSRMENIQLQDLGMTGFIHREYVRQIQRPQGLIIITGPTGSGKSTTLYATIKHIAGSKKILTAENPIEYAYPEEYSITQTQVNRARGVGYDELMDEFMRHDPDVIMLGEARNKRSSRTAVEAAQTGHLVFTTMHTEDSTGVVPRMRELLEMKAEQFLGQTKAVMAQMLVKKVCAHCAEQYTPDQEDILFYFGGIDPVFAFYRGTGCEHCDYDGADGRIGMYELWLPTRKVVAEMRDAGTDYEIRQSAIAHGLKPLYLAAIDLMQQGKITLKRAIEAVPNIAEDRELLGKTRIERYLHNLHSGGLPAVQKYEVGSKVGSGWFVYDQGS
ncbi:MAG: GspE/PulE family protein [Candidatus Electrothrix sp. YB6]